MTEELILKTLYFMKFLFFLAGSAVLTSKMYLANHIKPPIPIPKAIKALSILGYAGIATSGLLLVTDFDNIIVASLMLVIGAVFFAIVLLLKEKHDKNSK